MDFKNAVFDLDGTLIDSMPFWRSTQVGLLREKFGLKIDEQESEKLLYLSFLEMVEYAKKHINLNVKAYSDVVDKVMKEHYTNGEIPVKPFALEYLKYLKENNVGTALATSTPKDTCMEYIKKSGLYRYLDCIFTTVDDAHEGKANSFKVYDMAREALGGTLEDTVVFEEAIGCIRTCKKGGYTVYAVKDKLQECHIEEIKRISDRYINSYSELIGK